MNVFLIIHIHNNDNTQDELQFHQTQVMRTGLKYIQDDSRRRINILGGDTIGHREKKFNVNILNGYRDTAARCIYKYESAVNVN